MKIWNEYKSLCLVLGVTPLGFTCKQPTDLPPTQLRFVHVIFYLWSVISGCLSVFDQYATMKTTASLLESHQFFSQVKINLPACRPVQFINVPYINHLIQCCSITKELIMYASSFSINKQHIYQKWSYSCKYLFLYQIFKTYLNNFTGNKLYNT